MRGWFEEIRMSIFHFAGHPEIPTVPLPQGAHDVQTTVDADAATITYDTAQGAADLVFFFADPGRGWDGEFMTTTGVVELANADGTFGKDGAYYTDQRGETGGDPDTSVPVSGGDLVFPDFSGTGTAFDYAGGSTALSASLMGLGAADHLIIG